MIFIKILRINGLNENLYNTTALVISILMDPPWLSGYDACLPSLRSWNYLLKKGVFSKYRVFILM